MLRDGLVHQRLGDGRLIRFVMPMAAIADQVDHHVLAEGHAEFERQPRDEHDRLGIISIHVEDRRLHHLRHVGGIGCGAGVHRIGGGETNLVVDDDVHRAADREAAGLRHVEGLHHHALAGEGGIAMDQHRQNAPALAVLTPLLPRAHRAQHYRVHDLQVRGIEGQHEVNPALAAGRHVGGEAHVVLHVARG